MRCGHRLRGALQVAVLVQECATAVNPQRRYMAVRADVYMQLDLALTNIIVSLISSCNALTL